MTIAATIEVSGGRTVAESLADAINEAACYIDQGERESGEADAVDAAIARADAIRDVRRMAPRGADLVRDNFRAAIAQLSAISLLQKQAG
ncbi:MAG: hypothetical protein ACYDB1_04370 [Acidiferrobacteraceae bacterium]